MMKHLGYRNRPNCFYPVHLNGSWLLHQKVALANQEVINVVLEPDTEVLDEVVVVGYGSQKKESVVGAISTLDMRKLNVPGASISYVLARAISCFL